MNNQGIAEIAEAASDDAVETIETIEEAVADAAPATNIPLEITNDETSPDESAGGPAPTPKSTFSSYRDRFQPKRPGLLSGEVDILKKEEKTAPAASIEPDTSLEGSYEEPDDVAKDIAAKSVDEDNTIATETLANILARQGHFDKAIKMYEKLSIQYPEKSDTFAAKIEELKNK